MSHVFNPVVFDRTAGNAIPNKLIHGGKGAGLIAMCDAGLNVPPGIIIPIEACKAYEFGLVDAGRKEVVDDVMLAIKDQLNWLKAKVGYMPLLSVRSGAPVSMPGMMDTILNVGAFEQMNLPSERAKLDCQRRLIQMLGTTAFDVPGEVFDFQRAAILKEEGVKSEYELDELGMLKLVKKYDWAFNETTGHSFPIARNDQLRYAIEAVFKSWNSPRATEYRKLNKIPKQYGTAVVIQTMVFGNMNDDSATGVLFSRNPATGEGGMFGEFLVNAQGEDVVAGTSTPRDIREMQGDAKWQPIFDELTQTCFKLEALYDDMVDVEFTVQDGELFILQSRVAKRSALAAFVAAHDMVKGGLIPVSEAFKRLTREQIITIRLPSIDPEFKVAPTFKGLPASPGVVKGKAVHTSGEAVEAAEHGDDCILVRTETSPDDIAGMAKAVGILTKTGGATSHAAVVARAMDKPCVVGCADLDPVNVSGNVTIDGGTGNVWIGVDVPVVAAPDSELIQTVMAWAAHSQECDLLRETVQPEGPYHIAISDRWYSLDALASFVDDLAKVDCSEVVLDCELPHRMMNADDIGLLNCFGVSPNYGTDTPAIDLFEMLRANRFDLKGLTLVNFPMAPAHTMHQLEEMGFEIGSLVKAVPPEYALFAAIGKGV